MRERLERLQTNTVALSQRRIDDIVGYATAETCRHGNISAHFGSVPRSTCIVCDNCTGIRPDLPMPEEPAHPPPDDADIEPMIIDCLISLPKPVGRSGLARILAGSLRAPVQANECRHHGRLYTLGESTIMEYTDSLIEDSRLRQYERGGYPVLAATMRGRAEADTWLQEHPELAAPTAGPAEPVEAEEIPEEEAETYTGLQKALWLWRRRSADEQGQPAYVIMSNKTMLAIAEARPQSLEALGDIPGMGENRLEYYGGIILDLIQLNPAQEGDEALFEAQHAAGPRQIRPDDDPRGPGHVPGHREAHLPQAARTAPKDRRERPLQALSDRQQRSAQSHRRRRSRQRPGTGIPPRLPQQRPVGLHGTDFGDGGGDTAKRNARLTMHNAQWGVG